MRKLTKKLISKCGLYVARATPRDEIEALIAQLRPVNCGHRLVRLGGSNDGGYLLPDDLNDIVYCFSPGVDRTANFERDCLARGITSFLADYSVDAPPISLPRCQFLKKFVGAYNNTETVAFEQWIEEMLPPNFNQDIILQMDIEGAEYHTIISTPLATLRRFRIVVVEFHDFQRIDNVEFCRMVRSAVGRIREDFVPVHIHPNNCCPVSKASGVSVLPVFEVTFLRKDRIRATGEPLELPHPLDQKNFPNCDEVPLPANWLP